MKPLLQIALDVTSLDQAFSILDKDHLVDHVNLIEVGTVLLASEGKAAIKAMHERYPHKTLVADFKIADAIMTIGGMFYEAGANMITVIAAADLSTMKQAWVLAQRTNQQVQIELYGEWDMTLAEKWYQTGIPHIIYHHARDASRPWDEHDLKKIKALSDLGFQVSVTGNLKPETIDLFRGLEIYSFIVGRSMNEAPDPLLIAQAFNTHIAACFH